ncbi:MAG: methyltransferase domain-containing protein, partial [Candidatus Bathyarchaeia archaeon]
VLEYGVGTGRNLAALVCREKIGYDVAESVRSIVTMHGIRFVDEVASVEDCSIDSTICHHVLEHVTDPYKTLEDIRRVTRPGGKLLAFAPYEFERRYQEFNPNDSDMHLFSWTVQSLGALLESATFHVKEAKLGPFGYEWFAARHAFLGEWGYRRLLTILRALRPVHEIRIVAERP